MTGRGPAFALRSQAAFGLDKLWYMANRQFGIVLAALLYCGCAGGETTPSRPAAPPETGGTPLNHVWWMATHNAYWVNRGFDDPFGSGVDLNLHDQLAAFDVRTVEIDIHRAAAAHEFDVYHTLPGNTTCATLRACFQDLRSFHEAVTQHEVIHIVLEFKEIQTAFFTASHTVDDVDAVLRSELGDLLYAPRDLLRRCPGATTLTDCVRRRGWPSAASLRGRFIVLMLGNWDALGASNTAAWAQYATQGAVTTRAAFPMASSWMLDYAKLSPKVTALVDAPAFEAAVAQSAYLQVEDLADPRIRSFLDANGIIRAGAADTLDAQAAKRDLGIQMLQTDFPWVVPGGPVTGAPLRAFAATAETHGEPGDRVALAAPATNAAEAALYAAPGAVVFEAYISSGRSGRPTCLMALTGDGKLDGIGVCRGIRVMPGAATHQSPRMWTLDCTNSACTRSALTNGARALGPTRLHTFMNGDRYCISAADPSAEQVWVNDGSLCKDAPLEFFGVVTLAPDGVTTSSAAVGVTVRSDAESPTRVPVKPVIRSYTGVTVAP